MIFQTYNHTHYCVDIDIHDCIICFEEDVHTIQLVSLPNKACLCNSWIHLTCLEKWHMYHSSCPICRKELRISPPTIIIKRNDTPKDYYWVFYYFLQYAERFYIAMCLYVVICFIINILTYLQKHDYDTIQN